MSIDLTKPPREILTDMINADNATTFVASELVFGDPVVVVGSRNTRIHITAAGNSGFKGSVNVFYNRIELVALPGSRSKTFTGVGEANISSLLPAINAKYETNILLSDIVDAALPVFSGEVPNDTMTFTLQTAPTSFIYWGSVVLSVRRQDIDLSDIVTQPVLDSLILGS